MAATGVHVSVLGVYLSTVASSPALPLPPLTYSWPDIAHIPKNVLLVLIGETAVHVLLIGSYLSTLDEGEPHCPPAAKATSCSSYRSTA
jgi:hypothetical protein